MAQIKLSTEKFPGEDISFAEKLTQIKKNLDKDVAYKQLIHFANMISACLEVYGEENVIWQERDLHSLITPIVSISGNGVTIPPPPPPPPPPTFKTAPKNSAVVKAQKLLEFFEKNTFRVDKFKATLFALHSAIRNDIQRDWQNTEADVNHYKSAEKQLSREISTKENQRFISIVEVSNALLDLVLQGKINFVYAQQILDDVKKQIGAFTSKQAFQTYLFKTYNINNIDIKTISYKDAQKLSIGDVVSYRQQYQDAMSSINIEIQEIDAEISLYSSRKRDVSNLMSNKIMLQEKLEFLQKNVSIIERCNWQVVELIAERNAYEQQLQFYKNISRDIESCKIVQSVNKTKPLVAKKIDYDDVLAARVIPDSPISNKIQLLIKAGGIFKSCLSTTEYLDFIGRAKVYLLNNASLASSDVLTLQKGRVFNVEFGQFIEELILNLNTSNRKGAFALTLIEKELLNFAEDEHLFSVTMNNHDQKIIVEERHVPEQQRANYQLDHARLAYERNKYFFENFKNMLHIKDKDFFVTDFFTYEEIEKIISFLKIEERLLEDYDYDSEKTNNLLLAYINKKFSEEQTYFVDLIKDNKDHRAVYPICQMEDLLERLIMTDKPPYKLTDLINKQSARQYAQKYKTKEKQSDITDVAQVLPIESNVDHLERKEAKSPPPFIRVNSSKLLFNFNIVAALEKEINQPEISTIVFDANFTKTFDCFYETQQNLIKKHKDFYKQIDEEADEEAMKLLLQGNSIEQMNEMSIYHDLAIVKNHDQSIKILQEDLEDGSKKAIDLINISYKTEISHGNHIINKNIVKVDALKVDDNNELDDKSCIIMLLSIKNLSKNKKFTIEYCEDRPETAMKFFLFGKILGLTPTMNDETKQAIEQAKITPLKSCYLEVINPSVQLSSKEILDLLNNSLSNHDKKFLF